MLSRQALLLLKCFCNWVTFQTNKLYVCMYVCMGGAVKKSLGTPSLGDNGVATQISHTDQV